MNRWHRGRADGGGRRCRRPHGLFGRLMLIWLVGLAVVLAVSFALFSGERSRFQRSALIEHMAADVVTVVSFMDRLAPEERAVWLPRLRRSGYSFRLEPLPHGHAFTDEWDSPAWTLLREGLPGRPVELRGSMRRGREHGPALYLGTRLADGTPFLVEARPPRPQGLAGRLLAALAALVVGVAVLSWVAVRMATRPLTRLARAADALGEDLDRPPLAEEGPAEVRRAAAAFNRMQTRIRGLFDERTRILAAITHDLQTPITRLRLRSEMLDDESTRERMLSDLADMEALVREGLAYAGSGAAPKEEARPTDLAALLASLTADYTDAGRAVSLSAAFDGAWVTRPATLRRLMGNLVDNALKFGTRAAIELARAGEAPVITVRDDGPGIPEAELEKVFEPFYRVESSRSRETGGTGLGLAIARQLATALGADLALRNHPEGGLEARLAFRQPA